MASVAAALALLVLLPIGQGAAGAACLLDAIPLESRMNLNGLNGSGPVPFGLWVHNWDTAKLVSHVLKVLAEEVMGYNSTFTGLGSSSDTGLYATAGCHAPNDYATDPQCSGSPAFVHHVAMEVWGLADIELMRERLAAWSEVLPEDVGDLGYEGIDGIYILARDLEEAYNSEGLPLEYYRCYDARWNRPWSFFDNYSSFDPAEIKPCGETQLMYEAEIHNYLRVTGDNDGVVESSGGKLSARCWNGSWWFAPACRSRPDLCVPTLTASDGWHIHDMMQQATVFNMPLALAVARTGALWQSIPRQRRSLVYWWSPDVSFLDLQPTIITFPPFNAAEREQHILTSMTSNRRLSKWLHRQLGVQAPRLQELVRRVRLTLSLVNEMLLDNKQRGGYAHEEVACDWVRRSRSMWESWIPLSTECTIGKGLVGKNWSFVTSRADADGCAWCPAGRTSTILTDGRGITRTCSKCEPGRSQPHPGQSECIVCDAGSYADGYGNRECHYCNFGEYVARAGQSECSACPPTFITNSRGADKAEECMCPQGTYRGQDLRDACLPCKQGMKCPEGSDVRGYVKLREVGDVPLSVPLLEPGFWSSREEPLNVFRCEDVLRCPGGTAPGRACAGKFEMRACAACQEGFVASRATCVPCASGAVQILLFPVTPVAAVVVTIVALYFTSGQPYTRWDSWNTGSSTAFFITLNHYHAVNIIFGLDVISTWSSSRTFEAVSVLSNFLSLFKPQCSGLRSFTSQLILHSHGPGFILLLVVAIWLASQLLGLYRRGLGMEQNRLLCSAFSLILTFFTRVVDMSFTIFKCADNPNGAYTLVRDRSIVCYVEEWRGMVAIGASAASLWCVGFGTMLLHAIYVAPCRFHETTFQMRWAFLFKRHRPTVHWWSVTIVAKGVLINLGSLFIRSGIGQIYWILVVSLAYSCALFGFRPWRHLINNSVDNFAQISLALLAATSFCLATDEVRGFGAQTSLVLSLLTANVIMTALPFIPVVVVLWWRDRSIAARDRKDTDSHLIVRSLKTLSARHIDEQLSFLKGLTENDFQLLKQTKDMLLMEQDHRMARGGYSVAQLQRLSTAAVARLQRLSSLSVKRMSGIAAARLNSFGSVRSSSSGTVHTEKRPAAGAQRDTTQSSTLAVGMESRGSVLSGKSADPALSGKSAVGTESQNSMLLGTQAAGTELRNSTLPDKQAVGTETRRSVLPQKQAAAAEHRDPTVPEKEDTGLSKEATEVLDFLDDIQDFCRSSIRTLID